MGILQSLAGGEPDKHYIMIFNDLRLKVGPSDKAAAELLIERLDKYADGEHTNGEVLGILMMEWMEAVIAALPPEGHITPEVLYDDPKVVALWDAQWWLRFLVALDRDSEAQDA